MVAVLQPIKPGKLIAIDRAVVLVGRGSDCDAIISNSQKISRRHCCLVQVDNSYYLRDLGSMNGVWVNGARVTREAIIKSGDRISIGDVEFLFHPNARIEPKKTVTNGKPAVESSAKQAVAADSAGSTGVVADAVAESAGTSNADDVKLIPSESLEIIDDKPAKRESRNDEFEVVDDVIPLDDVDAYLVETNEVEIIDEPIIDTEGFDDDDDLLILED